LEGGIAIVANRQADLEGFDPRFYPELARLEDRNFWFRGRNELVLWALAKFFPAMQKFAEVGCGTGYVLHGISQSFPLAKLVATEIHAEALRYAQKRVPHAAFLVTETGALPYRHEFDLVGAFDVIEHIEDDIGALREIASALNPRGGLLLTVPQHQALWSATDIAASHKRRYSRKELVSKLNAAGFEVLWSSSFVSLLLPAMMLSRLRFGKSSARNQADEELAIPPVLNRIFSWTMGIESALIRAGFSMPWGGSLIVAARKFN
jgi:SAM-dependent methyltransferase